MPQPRLTAADIEEARRRLGVVAPARTPATPQPAPQQQGGGRFGFLGALADAGRAIVPQGVRDVAGTIAKDVFSAEEALNVPGFQAGTAIRNTLGRVPKIGGALGTAFDVGFAPATLATAGFGGGAANALARLGIAGRAGGSVLRPISQAGFGTRAAVEAGAATGGALASEEAARRGAPLPLQIGAGLLGAVAGGGAGFGAIKGSRAAVAAEKNRALREAVPEAFEFGRGTFEDVIPRGTVTKPGPVVSAGPADAAPGYVRLYRGDNIANPRRIVDEPGSYESDLVGRFFTDDPAMAEKFAKNTNPQFHPRETWRQGVVDPEVRFIDVPIDVAESIRSQRYGGGLRHEFLLPRELLENTQVGRLPSALPEFPFGGASGGAEFGFVTPQTTPGGKVRGEITTVDSTIDKLPDEFAEAIANTPGAKVLDEGIKVDTVRYQKPEQAGSTAVRGGVFFLPEKKSRFRHDYSENPLYGGPQRIEGEATYRKPLIVNAPSGGKVPERAYDALYHNGAYANMRNIAFEWTDASIRGEMSVSELTANVTALLDRYGVDTALAIPIVKHSTEGNQLAYALQEAIVATAVRDAGYDALLGYSKAKGVMRLSEVFDVQADTFPVPDVQGFPLRPER